MNRKFSKLHYSNAQWIINNYCVICFANGITPNLSEENLLTLMKFVVDLHNALQSEMTRESAKICIELFAECEKNLND